MKEDIKDLLGFTMKSVSKVSKGDDEMIFEREDGRRFRFYHGQDCCESVLIEDVNGEIEDLIGSPLLVAEMVDNLGDTPYPSRG